METDYTIIIKGGYLDITINGKKTNLLYSLDKKEKIQVLNACANLMLGLAACMYTPQEGL